MKNFIKHLPLYPLPSREGKLLVAATSARRLAAASKVAVFVAFFAFSCAGKKVPEPVVVEPEPPRPSFTEGSLWPGEEVHGTLFSDDKAARVGDIITVHLVEKTTASNKAATKKEHAQKNDLLISTGGSSPTQIGLSGGQKFSGRGDTSRSESLVSTISVVVVEVQSNGAMKIDGRRKLRINNADQFIRVTGLVRREDINYDNSVLSTKIANAEITYDGVGDLDKQQRAHWMGRIMDKVWPF